MEKIRHINCQAFSFSDKLSKDRIERALEAFGSKIVKRLLCFALYLLGLNRSDIGKSLDLPPETVKSIIKAIIRDGLGALEDRRRQTSVFIPPPGPKLPPITLKQEGQFVVVDFGSKDRQLKLNPQDPLQLRTVVLSMLNSGLLTNREAAQAICLTPPRTATLAQQLMQEGARSLVDKRNGQKQDYRVTPETKAELIQQFTVDVITGETASGTSISDHLKQRCQITIPSRTVRHHLDKLGLSKIKHSLPQLVASVKKTSKNGA